MTPPAPTRAEREDAIWDTFERAFADAQDAYYRTLAPAQAAYDRILEAARDAYKRTVAEVLDARDAALKALKEEG